ncbi:MAG: hypothetical protein IT290_05530 [Deltaproteobacteria bacterium]|nr:hypothetical protein [Deltaproteobacteria bacterium]
MSSISSPKTPDVLRKFGLVMSLAFTILCGVSLWREGSAWPYFLAIGGTFLVSAIYFPTKLAPLEKYWMLFGEKMSIVMTFIILTVMYYCLVTPLGIFLRLIGKDLLDTKLDKAATTYWHKTDASGSAARYYLPY